MSWVIKLSSTHLHRLIMSYPCLIHVHICQDIPRLPRVVGKGHVQDEHLQDAGSQLLRLDGWAGGQVANVSVMPKIVEGRTQGVVNIPGAEWLSNLPKLSKTPKGTAKCGTSKEVPCQIRTCGIWINAKPGQTITPRPFEEWSAKFPCPMTEWLLLHPFTFHGNVQQSEVILKSTEATNALFIALSGSNCLLGGSKQAFGSESVTQSTDPSHLIPMTGACRFSAVISPLINCFGPSGYTPQQSDPFQQPSN